LITAVGNQRHNGSIPTGCHEPEIAFMRRRLDHIVGRPDDGIGWIPLWQSAVGGASHADAPAEVVNSIQTPFDNGRTLSAICIASRATSGTEAFSRSPG
jgi:hypothetical protein